MKLVYTLSTGEYQPLSHKQNYLFNDYGKIRGFLGGKLKPGQIDRLAKPIRSDESNYDWYANLDGPGNLLSVFPIEIQDKTKKEYWQFREGIDKVITDLLRSKDNDRKEWGDLLNRVFDENNNIIISDGKDWALLWGWEFRNKNDLVRPNFQRKIEQEKVDVDNTNDTANGTVIIESEENETSPDSTTVENIPRSSNKSLPSIGMWERLSRFLRWFTYRYWKLLLFILFLLLLIYLYCRFYGHH